MTFEEVLQHFKVTTRNPDKAMCICPAHNDKEASLAISRGRGGRTVLYCFAGCKKEDILDAVGLKTKDLFEEPMKQESVWAGDSWQARVERKFHYKIEADYSYTDLEGNYAFTRLRLIPKSFRYLILNDDFKLRLNRNDKVELGLGGRKREDWPAVFCPDLKGLKKAISEGRRIFYCEGEKDVLTVNSHGLTGITCGGSDDWNPKCAVLFKGANVVILADNDPAGKNLASQVKADLQPVANSVRILVTTPELVKGDISDYFAQGHSVEDLEKLIEDQAEQIDLDQFHLHNDKGRITGVFDNAIFEYLKKRENLFVLGGTPYIYGSGVYRPDQSGAELKTMIRKLIYSEYVKSTTIKRIYDLFISDAELQKQEEDLNCYPVSWINFRNGMYDPVKKQLISHSPSYYATNQIPHDYKDFGVKGALVDDWLSFICEDPEDREMLLEYCGLCMTRDTRQQKLLILTGLGGTGKSTVIRMIDLMIGRENISNISLSQLSQRFAAFGLLGKLLNSCADLEIEALTDTSVLKKALGEDTLSAEAKGKDAISFRTVAKMIFSTNQLPIIKGELTNGFYRRLLILTMNRAPERLEPDFPDRLAGDIEYFIRLSVRALERLYERGRIIESPGSVAAVKGLRCDSDTVEAFLGTVVRNQDERTKKLNLFNAYEMFCQEMERQPLTKQNFYKAMRTKGFAEVKTSGTEYFKGIFLPRISHDISPDGFIDANGKNIPFEQGKNL